MTCESSTFVKTWITQKMVHRFGQRLCISLIRRTRHIIKCSRKRITRSKCRNNIRTILTQQWRLYNCRCKRYERKQKEACGKYCVLRFLHTHFGILTYKFLFIIVELFLISDCHKKNSVKKFCKFGVKFVVTLIWITKPRFKLCHLTRITTSQPVCKFPQEIHL